MKRRVVLITCLLGIVGGSAGAALADPPGNHQVCIVFANNSNWHDTEALCVDTPGNN
jgi:hypothetical protein